MSQTKVLEQRVEAISRDVDRLHSFLSSLIAEDPEGKYQRSFVARVLKASTRTPTKTFRGAESFLAELEEL